MYVKTDRIKTCWTQTDVLQSFLASFIIKLIINWHKNLNLFLWVKTYFKIAYLSVKFVFSYLVYGKLFLVLFVKRGHNIQALQQTNIKMDSWMLLPAVVCWWNFDFFIVNLFGFFSLRLGKIFDQLIRSLIFWDLLCQKNPILALTATATVLVESENRVPMHPYDVFFNLHFRNPQDALNRNFNVPIP